MGQTEGNSFDIFIEVSVKFWKRFLLSGHGNNAPFLYFFLQLQNIFEE